MTGRTARAIARPPALVLAFGLALGAAGCTSFYEIPIETPIKAKLDVSPFQRVHVVGFIAGGSDDVDANLETVRLLRSQLRTRSGLRVIEADVLPLAEIAQELSKDTNSGAATPAGTNGDASGPASNRESVRAAAPYSRPPVIPIKALRPGPAWLRATGH